MLIDLRLLQFVLPLRNFLPGGRAQKIVASIQFEERHIVPRLKSCQTTLEATNLSSGTDIAKPDGSYSWRASQEAAGVSRKGKLRKRRVTTLQFSNLTERWEFPDTNEVVDACRKEPAVI